jgi:hypothetical protein
MAETIHVNGVSNSLAHKGCMGFVKSTIPDVCKTPSPGGSIPVPYPVIVSFAKDLSKGTKTIKVDGGNSAAIKGSEYSRCTGDEPGTAGGIKSSTNMKEATWLLYSFDVKMDGKNACRLSDKMMMNHGNTVSLGGAIHAPVPLDSCDKSGLEKLAEKCNECVNCVHGPCKAKQSPSGHQCTTLGTKKHKCCERGVEKHKKEHSGCNMESEVAYDKNKKKLSKKERNKARSEANKAYNNYIDKHKKKLGKGLARFNARRSKIWYKAFKKAGGGVFIADIVMGNPKASYDFKFNCKSLQEMPASKRMTKKQIDKYTKYTETKVEVIAVDGSQCPDDCGKYSSENC